MKAPHGRRSMRLPGFNYASPGAYFVTICSADRKPIFGEVVAGEACPNEVGRIVESVWRSLPSDFRFLETAAFILMPNHLHGILILSDAVGAKHSALSDASPLRIGPRGTSRGSLAAIIQNLKSISTRRIRRLGLLGDAPVWQRGYYEHVIRGDANLARIQAYIEQNPARWEEDEYFV